MVRHAEHSRCRTLSVILKAGVFNAVLVTGVAALTIAVYSGAGTEDKVVGNGLVTPEKVQRSHSWHPIELLKAAAWLSPFTAITYGSFGLIAGLAGGGVMSLRARRIRSTKRFIAEAAILGFLLACLFPFFDVWTGQVQGIRDLRYSWVDLLVPAFGALFAFLCGLSFRNRFLAAGRGELPLRPAR